MEWKIWITWWILFCIRYSRLFWVYHQSKITKDENGENVPHLEITEVKLVDCNIVNNNNQQNSRVSYKFAPNKSFGQLLDISAKNFVFLKHLIQNFHMYKCGLLIKTLNCKR